MNTSKFITRQNECVTCAIIKTKIWNCCTNTNRISASNNCSSVTCSIITTINGSRLKIRRIFVCEYQYLSVTFAKILIGLKMVKKRKTMKNQQAFYKCNMCNNTIKITLYYVTTRKAAKGIKSIINSVDWQGLTNNYDRQIQGQTNFRSTFVMLK